MDLSQPHYLSDLICTTFTLAHFAGDFLLFLELLGYLHLLFPEYSFPRIYKAPTFTGLFLKYPFLLGTSWSLNFNLQIPSHLVEASAIPLLSLFFLHNPYHQWPCYISSFIYLFITIQILRSMICSLWYL